MYLSPVASNRSDCYLEVRSRSGRVLLQRLLNARLQLSPEMKHPSMVSRKPLHKPRLQSRGVPKESEEDARRSRPKPSPLSMAKKVCQQAVIVRKHGAYFLPQFNLHPPPRTNEEETARVLAQSDHHYLMRRPIIPG